MRSERPKVWIDGDHRWTSVGGVQGPDRVQMAWPGRRPGDPDVRGVIEVRDGRPVLAELWAIAGPGDRDVRLSDLARVWDASDLAEREWRKFGSVPDGSRGLGGSDAAERKIIEDEVRRAGRRAPAVPQAELERVAAIYREHAQHPDGRPVDAVADALDYSRSTASRRIKAAEQAGLLPATTPGKRREV